MLLNVVIDDANLPSTLGPLNLNTFSELSDDYILLDVEGIDPPKRDLKVYRRSRDYGGHGILGYETQPRSLILRLGYGRASNKSISERRDHLQRYFGLYRNLSIDFHSVDGSRKIDGYVEDIQENRFSAAPEVLITFLCPVPYFYIQKSESPTLSPSGSSGFFTFHNYGEIETHARIIFTATADITWFRMTWPEGGIVELSGNVSIPSRRVIRIDLRPGYRKAESWSSNLMGMLQANLSIPGLAPGSNRVYISTTPSSQVPSTVDLYYRELYTGAL